MHIPKLFGFNHHFCQDPWGHDQHVPPWAVELREMLNLVINLQEKSMATIDDIEADEAALKDAATSLINLTGQILAQLLALKNAPGLPADVATKIDDLHAKFHADLADITTAVSADGTAINPADPAVLPTPFISGINPSAGAPGDTVTISGSAFTGTESVDFGGAPAAPADIAVVDDKTINVKVPPGGSGKVTVTTAQGTSNVGAFTYNPPPAA